MCGVVCVCVSSSMDVAIQENHHFNEILLCDLGRVDCSFHRHLAEVKALVDAIHDQFRYLKTHPRVIRHLASIRHSASLAPYSHHRENGNGSGLVGVMPSTFEGLLDHLLQMEHYQEFRQLMENFAKAGQLLAKLRQYVVWNSVAVVKITKKRCVRRVRHSRERMSPWHGGASQPPAYITSVCVGGSTPGLVS